MGVRLGEKPPHRAGGDLDQSKLGDFAARQLAPLSRHTGYKTFVWIFCAAVAVAHLFGLPLLATFDSHGYVRLADVLGTSRYPADWDFLRTPLFPALLKVAFGVLGRTAMAVFVLQTALGCAGIWLLSRGSSSVAGVAVLSLFPTLIAYEHTLLSEVGSFFFLALVVSLPASAKRVTLRGSLWLAFAITAGFYYRPTLLYLAPAVAAVYVSRRMDWRAFAIIAGLPFLLAYPWQRNPQVAARVGRNVIFAGLVKQAVLPLNDPVLGDAAPLYERAVAESKRDGKLPNSGLTGGRQGEVGRAIERYSPMAGSIFVRVVLANPGAYLSAVGRELALFATLRQDPDDPTYSNASIRRILFGSTNSQIDPGPAEFGPLGDGFQLTVTPNIVGRALRAMSPWFEWAVRFGLAATMAALVVGIRRRDRAILAFTALPLVFIALHALLLLTDDRMIMPAQPILLWNLIMLPRWLRSGS